MTHLLKLKEKKPEEWEKIIDGVGCLKDKSMTRLLLKNLFLESKQHQREVLEGLRMKEREIRYEELDTGIGVDKLEYDGQEKEHIYNSTVKEINQKIDKAIKEL